MPRFNKKGTRIAFSIIGTPQNLKEKKSESEKKINRALVFQETRRSR